MRIVKLGFGLVVLVALALGGGIAYDQFKGTDHVTSKAKTLGAQSFKKATAVTNALLGKDAPINPLDPSELYFEKLSSYGANSAIKNMARAVGTFYVGESDGSSRLCVATLIATDKILTASECLLGPDGVGEVSVAAFIPQGMSEESLRRINVTAARKTRAGDTIDLCNVTKDAVLRTRTTPQSPSPIRDRIEAIKCGFVGCKPKTTTTVVMPEVNDLWCYAVSVNAHSPEFEGLASQANRAAGLRPGSLVILKIEDTYIDVEFPEKGQVEKEETWTKVEVDSKGKPIDSKKPQYGETKTEIMAAGNDPTVVKIVVDKNDKVLEIHREIQFLAKLFDPLKSDPDKIPIAQFHPGRPQVGQDLVAIHAGNRPSELQLTRFGCQIKGVRTGNSHFDHACAVSKPGLGVPLFDLASGGLVGVNVHASRVIPGYNAVASAALPGNWRPGFDQIDKGLGPVAYGATDEEARAGLGYYIRSPLYLTDDRTYGAPRIKLDPVDGMIDSHQFFEDLQGVSSLFETDSEMHMVSDPSAGTGVTRFVLLREIKDLGQCVASFESVRNEFTARWGSPKITNVTPPWNGKLDKTKNVVIAGADYNILYSEDAKTNSKTKSKTTTITTTITKTKTRTETETETEVETEVKTDAKKNRYVSITLNLLGKKDTTEKVGVERCIIALAAATTTAGSKLTLPGDVYLVTNPPKKPGTTVPPKDPHAKMKAAIKKNADDIDQLRIDVDKLFKDLAVLNDDVDYHHHGTYKPAGNTNVILVRHAEKEDDPDKKDHDIRLTKHGKKQAKALGTRTAAVTSIDKIDRGIATHAKRTKHTAYHALRAYERAKCPRTKDCATSRHFKLRRNQHPRDFRLGAHLGKTGTDLAVFHSNQICHFMEAAKVPKAKAAPYCNASWQWANEDQYGDVFWFCNGTQCTAAANRVGLDNGWFLYINEGPDGTALNFKTP